MASPLINQEFIIKYIFRFLHVFGFVAVGGRVMFAYLFPSSNIWEDKGANAYYYTWIGLSFAAGFVNFFILKPKEKLKEDRKLWIGLVHTKLVVGILIFTPVLQAIGGYSDKTYVAIQFYFLILFLIVSPFMRFYREHYTEVNRTASYAGDGSL